MSKLNMEDIVFGRSLREPFYRVDFAVGTTYSLDLDTFISLPFSLGFLEDPDEVMLQSPAYIFTALRICSDNLAVFCNYTDIKVPLESRKVYYALMENSVFPINAGNKTSLVNFHPKVWIIRQSGPNGSLVRLLIMSRNLTRDGSLDCACVMTGKIGNVSASKGAIEKHRPLKDFLTYLSKRATPQKRNRIDSLASDIDKIEAFDLDGGQFDDYDFLPMGIPGYNGIRTLNEISAAPYSVVISPFIDDTVMAYFAQTHEKMLLTRDMSVSPKAVEVFGEENIYTMNPQMVDNELCESVDLHAKMYFTSSWKHDEKRWRNCLYLGSANATKGGFDRNVEFITRLRFAPYKISWQIFTSYFKNDPEKRFMPMVNISDINDSRCEEYRQSLAFRRTASAIRSATVISEEDGSYNVIMRVGNDSSEAEIHPLMRPDLRSFVADGLTFYGLSTTELSEFYVLEIDGLGRVIKVPTHGIPEERNDAICRTIIDTKRKFYDCVSFLLSESKTAYIIDRKMIDKVLDSSSIPDEQYTTPPAIYENLLRLAYESPSAIEDINTFVNSLPEDVVPQEFNSLYKMFSKSSISLRR